METFNKNPIETTITIDHDRKVLFCWSNHKPTINQWSKSFPELTEKNTYSATLNNLPLSMVRKIKIIPKRIMSEDQKSKLHFKHSKLE